MREFSATLALPPSLNRSYHAASHNGRTVFYQDTKVKAWKENATIDLLAAGWKPLPCGRYRLTLDYAIYCDPRRDIDSPSKVLIDTCSRVLAIDDRHLLELHAIKRPTTCRREHRVEVRVVAEEWD